MASGSCAAGERVNRPAAELRRSPEQSLMKSGPAAVIGLQLMRTAKARALNTARSFCLMDIPRRLQPVDPNRRITTTHNRPRDGLNQTVHERRPCPEITAACILAWHPSPSGWHCQSCHLSQRAGCLRSRANGRRYSTSGFASPPGAERTTARWTHLRHWRPKPPPLGYASYH